MIGKLKSFHDDLATEYEAVRLRFFDDINRLLLRLQEVGSAKPPPFEQFDPNVLPQHWQTPPVKPKGWKFADHERDGKPFYVLGKESLWMTLWWRDDDNNVAAQPQPGDLRVETHVEAHRDYATISFYIDTAKIWGRPEPVRYGNRIVGRRRERVFESVETVKSKCDPRLIAQTAGTAAIDREVVPEHDVSTVDAQSLMAASRYLYSELWDEFAAAFKIGTPQALVGDTGRVFANFRGLVVSTAGIVGPSDLQPFPGSTGAKPFPRFRGDGGLNALEDNEANAVIKAYWPFIRRISPFADEREFVACGVMNWRALYVTALGSTPRKAGVEENRSPATEVPNNSLPEALLKRSGSHDSYDAMSGEHGEEPVRYLFITKGEPHRRQIGRIVDRINTMGTMRLAALTDFTVLRDASTQLQLLGLALDEIMGQWSGQSTAVRVKYEPLIARVGWLRRALFHSDEKLQDDADDELYSLARDVGEDLSYLGAEVDKIGLGALYGLHFRINRSKYYVFEFDRLLETLRVGNIDSWVAYDQFVTRGLRPAFDFIAGVGDRLTSFRERLQSVTDAIQASALVIQASRTRANTAVLRRLGTGVIFVNVFLALIALIISRRADYDDIVKILMKFISLIRTPSF